MFQSLEAALSETNARLIEQPLPEVIDAKLSEVYDRSKATGRLPEFKAICRSHSLASMILEDPYSRRAFEKPRGFAGDAVMLDYIYRPNRLKLSAVASIVHQATTGLPNAKSILWRRKYLAEHIISTVNYKPAARILSVASGHMRELDIVAEVEGRRDFEIVALDQDPASIDECLRSYPGFSISPIVRSISYILRGKLEGESFDLIYSAGLFDYLGDKTAECLIRKLYACLRADSVLTIANFAPDSHGRGFMEGFMDWSLIYRDEADMMRLLEEAVPTASSRIFRDAPGNVVYAEIRRP